MHEVKAIRTAILSALGERDAARAAARAEGHADDAGAWRHLELEIVDPTRATPEALSFYAPAILDELGVVEVGFDIFTRAARCAMCGRLTHPEPSDPVCQECGAPIPRTEGPAILAQWTRPVEAPAATPGISAREVGAVLAAHPRRHHPGTAR